MLKLHTVLYTFMFWVTRFKNLQKLLNWFYSLLIIVYTYLDKGRQRVLLIGKNDWKIEAKNFEKELLLQKIIGTYICNFKVKHIFNLQTKCEKQCRKLRFKNLKTILKKIKKLKHFGEMDSRGCSPKNSKNWLQIV